ncbi:E3 ubiquitin/ISG15 ligase TRIM25-like [Rana temporaria]|uniref:E3 ubiquitin/ISG15 ligase TRIM25-like n=1 Tax=Rana temporaria TaxID=8407 RepID=UPI001AAD645E|nr:E3 ubiquitin/ISG15 ligase TRIM25-like [Rana temporaria]
MALADTSDDLNCSICLNIYTDPVNLRCGHSYCRECIEKALDEQLGSGVYKCPRCRKEFPDRPALHPNLDLRNIADRVRSQATQKESGIFCTYCIHTLVPAVKSCLLCEASLCDNHLSVHIKSPEHLLTEPTRCLRNSKCPVHNKILEFYCMEDSACVCVTCRLDGDHVGHRVETLAEASEKKLDELRQVQERLTSQRVQTEKRVHKLQDHSRRVREAAAGLMVRVTVMFREIRRQIQELEKRVLGEISKQEEKISLSVSHVIENLDIKKNELCAKIFYIEEMCNMGDPVTVLQEKDTADFCASREEENKEREMDNVGDLDEDLISLTIRKGLSNALSATGIPRLGASDTLAGPGTSMNLKEIGRMTPANSHAASDLLLDENTAGNQISISEDLKTIYWTMRPLNRPMTPHRFQYNQVLSVRVFLVGRHYWDVESSRTGDWRIGVAYTSMLRRGDASFLGYNRESWCLRRCNNTYSVWHDNRSLTLPPQPSNNTLRVHLEYEDGQLAFYELGDRIRHLYTFTAKFNEPLHAAFHVSEDLDRKGCRLRIIT